MKQRIIFATGNEGKMKEVRMILEDLGLPVLSLKDAGITADVEENGTTFEENAQIKWEKASSSPCTSVRKCSVPFGRFKIACRLIISVDAAAIVVKKRICQRRS